MATGAAGPRTVEAEINYLGPMASMPYFYARDHARDNLALEPHRVEIADRLRAPPQALLHTAALLSAARAGAGWRDRSRGRDAVERSGPRDEFCAMRERMVRRSIRSS